MKDNDPEIQTLQTAIAQLNLAVEAVNACGFNVALDTLLDTSRGEPRQKFYLRGAEYNPWLNMVEVWFGQKEEPHE